MARNSHCGRPDTATNERFSAEFENLVASGSYEAAHVVHAEPSRYRRSRSSVSVGLDVVSIAEVAASLDRFGDHYVLRVFTTREASYCRAGVPATAAARFAVRFAAKEAAIKALQPDHHWADWRAIEVRRHKSGRCTLVLHGEAAALASRRRVQNLALSMSHDGDRAAAVVVAVRARPA